MFSIAHSNIVSFSPRIYTCGQTGIQVDMHICVHACVQIVCTCIYIHVMNLNFFSAMLAPNLLPDY